MPVEPPPSPGAFTARFCSRLRDALPARLGELSRRDVSPDVAGAAAYGDPPVVLRCGVGPVSRPPGDTSEVLIASVKWYPAERPDDVVWTTIDLPVPVEATVPKAYDGQLLARLAEPLRAAAR